MWVSKMRRYLISFYIIGLLVLSSFTIINPEVSSSDSEGYEELEPVWERSFGKEFGDDEGRSVVQTSDGGYIVVGATESYGVGDEDIWLIKTNATGIEEWNETYGGSGTDRGNDVKQTLDGGYIITGYTLSFGAGGIDLWLVKTNESGEKQWDKIFGGSGYEQGKSVRQTLDGSYIITGYTDSFGAGREDVWLIKTDSFGNMEWNKTFGGNDTDIGSSVLQTSDGGYLITGQTQSFDLRWYNIWLIKTNESGDEEWNRTYGEGNVNSDNSLQQTSDEGFLIVGTAPATSFGNIVIMVIKTNSIGDVQWNKTFGEEHFYWGVSGQETSDGGYVIAGFRTVDADIRNYCNIYLIRIDSSGNEQWTKTYGGDDWYLGISMQLISDKNCVITGWTSHNLTLLEFDFDKTKVEIDDDGKKDDESRYEFSMSLFQILVLVVAVIFIILIYLVRRHSRGKE